MLTWGPPLPTSPFLPTCKHHHRAERGNYSISTSLMCFPIHYIAIYIPFLIRYRWLSFINPNYYGFSASTVILLSDFKSDCERDGGSELECYTTSGKYVLDSFDFTDVNPYANIVVSKEKLILLFMIDGDGSLCAFTNTLAHAVGINMFTWLELGLLKQHLNSSSCKAHRSTAQRQTATCSQ